MPADCSPATHCRMECQSTVLPVVHCIMECPSTLVIIASRRMEYQSTVVPATHCRMECQPTVILVMHCRMECQSTVLPVVHCRMEGQSTVFRGTTLWNGMPVNCTTWHTLLSLFTGVRHFVFTLCVAPWPEWHLESHLYPIHSISVAHL